VATETLQTSQNEETNTAISTFKLTLKHTSLDNLYNEWYGKGNFDDDCSGVLGQNAPLPKDWRKVASVDATQYSCHNHVVKFILDESRHTNQ
jgi:hypothetical protein